MEGILELLLKRKFLLHRLIISRCIVMNDDYLEFNLLDVNDESFLASNEEIICRHCQVISYIEYGAKEEKEIIDFSFYDFNTGKGKVVWGNYYTDMGIN